jgi:hypothetical protein
MRHLARCGYYKCADKTVRSMVDKTMGIIYDKNIKKGTALAKAKWLASENSIEKELSYCFSGLDDSFFVFNKSLAPFTQRRLLYVPRDQDKFLLILPTGCDILRHKKSTHSNGGCLMNVFCPYGHRLSCWPTG